ncbi:transcriptional regulator, TetR family [Actinomadura meyerae]|jgi:AcrR family transcriptional regulator|uniref:Transcriptional regulator, TetR family n=1 Tax=Actinomadura meyerae TaxID=240840 RepID=A0A239P5C5_9ACTN|nr:TetR/AcrR family transcriptional regulator [Actinomadura meyerae]SNT61519.1 transcriptional regulator, TetR family [Actinomadura meyerae]
MSPKHQGTDETVARILAEALRVHAERGHDGFTMKAVIAATGMSSGSLYHHFGSFDGLAAALYARCMGELLDALLDALDGITDAQAGVEAVTRAYLRFTRERSDAARFVHASAYAAFLPEHAATLAESKAPRIARLIAWMAPHVAADRVARLSPAMMEMLLIGPVAETARRWLSAPDAVDLDEAAAVLPPRIWRSLQP